MKSKSLLYLDLGTLLVLSLLAGGCSGENPPQPFVARTKSAAGESSQLPFASEGNERNPDNVTGSVEELTPVSVESTVRDTPDQGSPVVISWDFLKQSQVVTEAQSSVLFHFQLTNVSQAAVAVESVTTSCGCTTIDSETLPYSLAGGETETIHVSMNVAGKRGTVTKSVFVRTSCGNTTLLVTAELMPSDKESSDDENTIQGPMSFGSREQNMELAKLDRQAVFKGSCAACHARYAEEQFGYYLYLGACAVCHDAEHRATMVPALRDAGVSRDADYWRDYINDGVEGTLMPAFAIAQGGILDEAQVESLVKFLVENPSR
ncbi:MAG TPA: DUF1573 domain-containing protein [Planctomycetaceae bacterium]|nr:DUF1573 domain-containing protein [Planctomycetaceae bacterium]HQZ64956.1 DUF1573 domain-containing protein [Planctomycetaceae bacterium]